MRSYIYIIKNTDTGDFYSESLFLEDEATRTGKKWKHTSVLPLYAKRYTRRTEAIRRSRELSDQTGCVFTIIKVSTAVPT